METKDTHSFWREGRSDKLSGIDPFNWLSERSLHKVVIQEKKPEIGSCNYKNGK